MSCAALLSNLCRWSVVHENRQEAKHAKMAWKQAALRDFNVICSKHAANFEFGWLKAGTQFVSVYLP